MKLYFQFYCTLYFQTDGIGYKYSTRDLRITNTKLKLLFSSDIMEDVTKEDNSKKNNLIMKNID